jgi:hypothetical protein
MDTQAGNDLCGREHISLDVVLRGLTARKAGVREWVIPPLHVHTGYQVSYDHTTADYSKK